jgi:3-oxoacyl-[acyl-carrier-protein] synthase I
MKRGFGEALELQAWEIVCSLGDNAQASAALWEAGIVNLAPSRFVLDDGQRAEMCICPAVPQQVLGCDRMLNMAQLALRRLVTSAEPGAMRAVSTLLLSLPASLAARPGSAELNTDGLELVRRLAASELLAGLGVAIEAFPFGRAGAAPALYRARQLVTGGRRVLWGGVDSQHDWTVLSALANARRLLTPESTDGIRPGEGAAFALLGQAQQSHLPLMTGLGLGRQPGIDSEHPVVRSEGLTTAIRAATEPLREQRRRCGYWLFDTTHEARTTQQIQHVLTSCADIVGLNTTLHTPLKSLGDTGAASLPLFAALAAEAWRHGSADDNTALLASCSDDGACGAVLLAQNPAALNP